MDKRKILIVDDDLDMRRAMHMRLRANHYETAFATDGMTAMIAVRKEKPDLIILDLGLPAGDGYIVLQRLRLNPVLACIPVIVVSARDPAENEARTRAAGSIAYLQKPPDPGLLLATIERALGQNESGADMAG